MTKPADLPALLESFFTQRLIAQRRASPHTIASYRDTFRLLLHFAQRRLRRPPSQLLMGSVQPNLDVFFRERQALGSLRSRHLFHVAHHHDCPVLLRQALDSLFEDLAHLDRGSFRFGV